MTAFLRRFFQLLCRHTLLLGSDWRNEWERSAGGLPQQPQITFMFHFLRPVVLQYFEGIFPVFVAGRRALVVSRDD